jgi:NADPH-dependent ferric siderophore reductase
MTVDATPLAPSFLAARATVRHVERLTPAFVRVTLESPAFVDLGIEGFDTRFKLVLPGPAVRTYTVRDVVQDGHSRLLVVDLVVHEHGPQGPACRWALAARPGDVVEVIVPHRAREYGGTEFDPGDRGELLLVADETAVPALGRILADLGPGRTGRAFAEVPSAADVLDLPVPPGIELTWLVRGSAEHGRGLVDEVRRDLGLGPLDRAAVPEEVPSDLDVEVWETVRHSSSGEDLAAPGPRRPVGTYLDDLYAWIAGESWLVKALRRSLVTELGVDRRQVAFMGYWRQGVAMRS